MLHVVINPTAGSGRGARVGAQITKLLTERGIAHVPRLTQGPDHATELARSAALSGARTVLAVGGDGTVLETARGLYGTGAALGVIAAGTGNDVAKMLHVPKKPADGLAFLLSCPPRRLDAGLINDKLFLNVCGTGFDVCVLGYAQKAKKIVRGMLPYLWGVVRAIFTYQPVSVTFEVDGEAPQTKPLLLLAVANGRYFGGGIDVAPTSKPDDGLFDLIVIETMPRWKMPFQLPKLVNGRVFDIPGISFRRCHRVTMTAKDLRVNVDGEVVPAECATLEMLPGSLLAHW